MTEFRKRKNSRLQASNYYGHSCYFVTFCCFERKPIFREGRRCRWLLELLQTESARNCFLTHAYCLMPDHLHFLTEGMDQRSNLLHLVKCLKLKSSRAFATRTGQILWQKGFYEHILRPGDPLESVAWYIWLNPVRCGIAQKAEGFAGSGSFSGMQMPMVWNETGWLPPWK